ncbi:MAG: hypothetical protein MI674_00400, partial [Cytophagales bacterium]|nr:hypothetical protein [Cytophagales bacterium]
MLPFSHCLAAYSQIRCSRNHIKSLLLQGMIAYKEKPNGFLLRRLQCQSPDGGEYVLPTSLLDKTIGKHEIQE